MLPLAKGGIAMKKAVILTIVLGLVTSCDKGGVEMKNASVQQVGEAMRKQGDDKFVDPGKWQQTVTLVSIDAPGMPKEARDAMQRAMSTSQVNAVCLSPEEAK